MASFFEFLATNELTIVVCLLVAVFILIMTVIIIDIISKNKSNKKDIDDDFYIDDELDKTNIKINTDGLGMVADETALDRIDVEAVTKNLEKTQEIEEIKYVEEDEELEKTKALLELETLKKELAKMEQEKEIEETPIVDKEENNEIVQDAVIEVKTLETEDTSNTNEIEPIQEQVKDSTIDIQNEMKVPTMEDEVEAFESSQEEHAIISVDELMKASENITAEEIEEYEDDGNEPISIKELEALYKSVEEPVKVEIKSEEQNEEKTKLPEFEIKVKPAIEVYDGKEFKNSSVISPVFGLKKTEESITLEHTANLDKLNEEIRKTNEFLSMLKELRKNLE